MTPPTPLEIAERALALAGPDAQVTVVRERSLMSRYARSAPTQATAIDDTSVEILCLRDGHTSIASTNRLDDDALRATAASAQAAARAAAASGPGNHPGLAEPAEALPHDGFDAATARLDPEARRGRAARRLRGRRRSRRSRRSASGPSATSRPRSRRRPACGCTTASATRS